jgi:N-methylhydantoinase A
VTADLRYVGQAFEVRVDLASRALTAEAVERAAGAFHDEHRRLYGYDFRDDDRQEVEWVNLRVSGVGPIRKPELRRIGAGAGAESALLGTRKVSFDDWVETACYDRSRLGHGDEVTGPAVIEEFSSTVPLHPGFAARVDEFGNLVIGRDVT